KVNFWDVAGDQVYYEIRNEFYKDTNGVVLVFDVSAQHTFDVLDKWVDELQRLSGPKKMVVALVGNKIDNETRVVSTEEGKAYAEGKGFRYWETSAATGAGVQELFESLFQDALHTVE
ncbi:DnaJ sub C member 27, partial [Quaeritorhiza haematococci]